MYRGATANGMLYQARACMTAVHIGDTGCGHSRKRHLSNERLEDAILVICQRDFDVTALPGVETAIHLQKGLVEKVTRENGVQLLTETARRPTRPYMRAEPVA